MTFKPHVIGGSMAGVITITIAQISGFTSASLDELVRFVQNPLPNDGNIAVLIGLFLTTLFMSLFPDLDTASILQRWFYRLVLLVLATLFLTGQMGVFAAVSFIVLLPLLHKHQGWTHSKITPLVLAVLFAVIIELHRSTQSWFAGFSATNVANLIKDYWVYAVACVLGHYTHLLLDWKL